MATEQAEGGHSIELELSESRRQLACLVDNLPGVAYRCEAHAPWRMNYISGGVEALTGYAVADMLSGRFTWADLMHADDLEAVEAEVEAATRERRRFSVGYRLVHRSGEVRWVQEKGQAIYGDDGAPLFLEGFIGDITEQKLLEASLRKSEEEAQRNAERLSAALEGTMDCVYSLGRDWRLTYLNRRAREQFGGREDLLGRTISSLVPGAETSVFADSYRRVMETGVPECLEGHFPPTGVWYEVHVTPTDDGITVFYRDVTARKEAEEALKASKGRIQSILDSVPQIIWSARRDGVIDYLSNQWQEFSGKAAEANRDLDWLDAVHPDDQAKAAARWQHSLTTGVDYEAEFRVRTHAGTFNWILVRARPVRDQRGRIERWYGTCTDIHQRVLAQAALQESEAINSSIIAASPDCISMLDLEGNVIFVNEAVLKTLRLASPESLVGKPWGLSFHASVRGAARHALVCAREGRIGHFTALQRELDGEKWWDVVVAPVLDAAGAPNKLVVISRDITHQKTAEERVRWTANHDVLTQLPNRAFFQQTLDQKLKDAQFADARFGLLLLDLDDFKRVNDTLGHDAGDALLCCFADQLRAAARPDDFIARLGGDEFAVILNGVANRREVETAVDGILSRLKEPCAFGDRLLDCQASIGASLYPTHGANRAELLKHADIALYVAKASGRGFWRLFEPSMRAETQQRVSMLAVAAEALAKDRIVPFYQPKVDLHSGALSGFEALLRWRHPRRGMQLPDTMAAAFQDLKLAAEISDRMIDRVIHDMRSWLDQGLAFGHVAINAAAAEFRRGDFAERLLERLKAADIAPALVQLEVTETVFLGRGSEYVERALKTLSREGVEIALDDFGTGYASLSHLKQFPVDVLKIDRSFVQNLDEDPDNAAIVRAVINLGKSLSIRTIAEGIETEEQARYLTAHGCDAGQGFLYAKAIAAAQVPALISEWGRRKDLCPPTPPAGLKLVSSR